MSDPQDPMDYSLPGSSVHGIFQARVLEWGAVAHREQFSTKKRTFLKLIQGSYKGLRRINYIDVLTP